MPEPIKLQFKPGIHRETTDYGNMGGYYDCNLVRFREGTAETMGGWQKFTAEAAQGTWRSLFPFSTLNGQQFYASGTNLKYYLVQGNQLVDITPIRASSTINNNPFAVTDTLTTVTVTDTAHGAAANDFVTFSGATATGGIAAGTLNTEYQIVSVIDADSYTIVAATAATSTTTGGGGSVVAAYQISVGLDTTVSGNGYGTGGYGVFGYGEGSDTSVVTDQLRLWSEDNFGEDMLFNVRNGGIYYKDMSSVSGRGVNITTLGDGPSVATQIIVSDNDRHVLAFGVNPVGSATQDRLLIRWSDAEDVAVWTPSTTNTAGSLRLEGGSAFMKAVETTTETLVFTDATLHSLKYVGPPFIFGQVRVGSNIHLIGPNAVVTTGSETYWMAEGRFQMYDGVVRDITPPDVRSYIFSILNGSQSDKIYAGINRQFGEVVWHIPVNGSEEVNFYVIFNYVSGYWYYGNFNDAGRTTWLDSWYEDYPLAGAPDGYIYLHDIGATDGSTTPAAKLDDYLVSSVFELDAGGRFCYVTRYIPDFDFTGSSAANPAIEVTFATRDYPGSAFATQQATGVTRTVSTPVEQYTSKNDIRFRGRSVQYTIASTVTGTQWQQGVPRLYFSPDGQR